MDKTNSEPFRVMVCDDSAVIRGLVTKCLEKDSDIVVVSSVSNGAMAINALKRYDIEAIVLDIEMPVMDGITAIPKLLEIDPHIQIIMASTLTLQNAEISLKALSLGAADYVAKPSARSELHSSTGFQRELVDKVKALVQASRNAHQTSGMTRQRRVTSAATDNIIKARQRSRSQSDFSSHSDGKAGVPQKNIRLNRDSSNIELRQARLTKPDVIAIGSSTGGPQALFEVLSGLKGHIDQPILITQHMPATFTTILAEHIQRSTGLPCQEAQNDMVIERGHVYVAPGDYHMLVSHQNGQKILKIEQSAPENFCRPAVDPMLRSVISEYQSRILVVILTGMGRDGYLGAQSVVEAGGAVIAQDEETSVVWGMPGAVAAGGLCHAVLPLTNIGQTIISVAKNGVL